MKLAHPYRILLLLFAAVLSGCGQKEGPRESAERFFTLCEHGKLAEAYRSASDKFKYERSQKYFEARVRELGLDNIEEAPRWGEMKKEGKKFVVRGEFKPKEEPPLVLLVSMIEDGGAWRVLEAQRELPKGAEDAFSMMARSRDGEKVNSHRKFTEPVASVVPTEQQLQKLVEEALLKFDEAVKADDFTEFFNFVSDRWKYRGKDKRTIEYTGNDPQRVLESDRDNTDQRITIAALKRAFGRFVEAKVDLSPIKGKKMILDEPATVNTEGVLTVKGRFDAFVFQGAEPPKPERMEFKLEFVLEGAKWRIFGVQVTLPNSGSAKNSSPDSSSELR